MYKYIGLIVVLLFSQSIFAMNLPDFPFVVSVGESEKDVRPNMATIKLDIMAFEKESVLALKQANIATKAVTDLLQEYGFGAEHIEATDIGKSTKRKTDAKYNTLDILGYEVSRSITIRLKDLSKYSEIMSDLVAINNVAYAGAAFDFSSRKEIEAELLEIASRDAKLKAEKMAHSLGTNIHSVYAISQASGFIDFVNLFGAKFGRAQVSYYSAPDNSANTMMFIPKTVKVKQRINVVFKIKPIN